MMHGRKMLVCIAGAFALCAGAKAMAAESGGTPYQGIVDRNIFGLKAPAPPPNPEDNKPPPPKITLTGIFTILGNKRAMMKVMAPPKPGTKQEEQSYILAVGQRDGDIEVLDIDEKAGIVKVNNFGTVTNINFENNGVKLVSAPAPGVPGAPPNVGGGIPPPPGVGFTPGGGGYVPRAIPTPRPRRTNPGSAAPYPAGAGGSPAGYGGASSSASYSAVPGMATPGTVALSGLGGPPSTPTRQQNWPPEPTSPEAAAILEHIYNTTHANEIQDGRMPAVPGGNAIQEIQNNSGQNTKPSRF